MRVMMTVFYLTLILIGVSFAALNATSVPVNLYFTTLNMPISILMTVMVGLGISIGFILFLCKYLCLKGEHRKLKNQLKLTEREIKNLRTIPLRNEDTAF